MLRSPVRKRSLRPGQAQAGRLPGVRARGFTLIEVMAAIFLLTVGTVSVAMLATVMLTRGRQSKYATVASTLASEKLEDLNRYSAKVPPPEICVPTGNSSVGSLSADVSQTTTCPSGASASIAYYDDVNIAFAAGTDCANSSYGCFSETVSSAGNGASVYTTTYHSPDGVITTASSGTAPSGNVLFHRRWIIEANEPVTGTRRVTVLVTLPSAVTTPVKFQMSMVRP